MYKTPGALVLFLLLFSAPHFCWVFPEVSKPLVLVRMPDESSVAKSPEEKDIVRFATSHQAFLQMSMRDLLDNPDLGNRVVGQDGTFEELKHFYSQYRIPVKVQFIAWNDALRYFADYASDPTNDPIVAQLGDTWAAHFRSLEVLPYEQRYSWDVRLLWYWKDLVDPGEIADGQGFVRACRNLRHQAPPGLIAPLVIPTAPNWDLLHDLSIWLYNAGVGSLISTDRKLGLWEWKEAVFAGPEGQRAARFLIQLASEGLVALPEESLGQVAERFLAREYAMVILGTWLSRRAVAALGEDWTVVIGATMPPTIGAASATTFKGGSLLVVIDPSRGQRPSEVARARFLVDFLTSAESQRRYRQAFGELPGNPEILSSPSFAAYSEALKKARSYPQMPEWAQVIENLATRDNLYAFWKRLAALEQTRRSGYESEQVAREKSVLSALHSAQSEINRELSLGGLYAQWPWAVGAIALLSIMSAVSYYRRRIERQWSLRKLAESEAKYRDLYDNAPDMLASVDADTGLIVECNQAVVNKTGYSRKELIGRHIFEIYHPACLEEVRKALEIFRETGQLLDLELSLRTRQGGRLPVSVNVSAIRDEQGRVLRSRSIWRDITKQKEAEETAQRQRLELAHIARVATIGELTTSLAHELNQPLTAVVTNCQAAQRLMSRPQPDLDEVRDALADIAEEGKRAAEVIRALRTLLRREESEPRGVKLNEIIQEVVALLQGQTTLRNAAVRLELSPVLPVVLGNSVQLRQVILNLLVNASEAMEHLNADSQVLVIRSWADNGTVRVAVSDNGVGLEEALLVRMFDAFFTTKPTGLGMGLSINRSIIEAHGGKLWATPNSDRGATLHFTLPVRDRVEE